MNQFIYGLDFGTTNSSISILDLNKKEVIKSFSLPSLVFFPTGQKKDADLKYFVGESAKTQYVESNMCGRFIKSIKKALPQQNIQRANIYGRDLAIEKIVSLIIMELKNKADEYLNQKIDTVVAGRPVVFDKNKAKDKYAQLRLKRALALSGFKNIYFQLEPVAAAYAYERKIKKPEVALIADFGGGTSDFSIIKLSPLNTNIRDRSSDIISTQGIYVGGDMFDSAFMWEKCTPHFGRGIKYESYGKMLDLPKLLFLNICSWEKINFFNSVKMQSALQNYYYSTGYNSKVKNLLSLIEHNLTFSFFQEIEKLKIKLSTETEAQLNFNNQDIVINEAVELDEYNNLIETDLSKIESCLSEFLANFNGNKIINSVFSTGGTSSVAAIQDMLLRSFPKEKLKSGDNFMSVSEGLAYSYLFLSHS